MKGTRRAGGGGRGRYSSGEDGRGVFVSSVAVVSKVQSCFSARVSERAFSRFDGPTRSDGRWRRSCFQANLRWFYTTCKNIAASPWIGLAAVCPYVHTACGVCFPRREGIMLDRVCSGFVTDGRADVLVEVFFPRSGPFLARRGEGHQTKRDKETLRLRMQWRLMIELWRCGDRCGGGRAGDRQLADQSIDRHKGLQFRSFPPPRCYARLRSALF